MLFTTHAIVGAAIGAASPNPTLGFILGALSHHVLDSIIHFDQGSLHRDPQGPNYLNRRFFVPKIKFTPTDWKMLFSDFALAGVLFGFILFSKPLEALPHIIAGTLGGLFPDLLHGSPLWSAKLIKKNRLVAKYNSLHTFFHWTAGLKQKYLGLLTQIILIALALYKLF